MKSTNAKLSLREIILFAVFGALMFISKVLMDALPNIHLIAVFTVALTSVYRSKALIPLYVFVFLTGIYGGFSPWWLSYLYVWLPLWIAVMLLPKKLPEKLLPFIYCAIVFLHGLSFGTLCAPMQAITMHFGFKTTLSWIASGFSFDLIHAIGNLAVGTLICPLIMLLRKLESISAAKNKQNRNNY